MANIIIALLVVAFIEQFVVIYKLRKQAWLIPGLPPLGPFG